MSHIGSLGAEKESDRSSSAEEEQSRRRQQPRSSSPTRAITQSLGSVDMGSTTGQMATATTSRPQASVTRRPRSHTVVAGSSPIRGVPRAHSSSSRGSPTSMKGVQEPIEGAGRARMTLAQTEDTQEPRQIFSRGVDRSQRRARRKESSRIDEQLLALARQSSASTSSLSQASSSGISEQLTRERDSLPSREPKLTFVGGCQSAPNRMLNRVPISPFAGPSVPQETVAQAAVRESSNSPRTQQKSTGSSGTQMQPKGGSSHGRGLSTASGASSAAGKTIRSRLTGESHAHEGTSDERNIALGAPQRTRISGGINARPLTAHLTPPGFNPLPAPRRRRLKSEPGPKLRLGARPRNSIVTLGIEAEFTIAAKDVEYFRETRQEFASALAEIYNAEVAPKHPRMLETLRPWQAKDDYDKWSLINDESITLSQRSPWGLELVSPIFRAFPGSKWREDVEAVWKHLRRYYDVEVNDNCATHVHISLDPWYSMQEVKRIAQAAIYFEPAFEVLVPPIRRGNMFARSLWLDSPLLVARNSSRSQLIDDIEAVEYLNDLIPLIQEDRDYCWNFFPLFDRDKGTIEFRKPPASTTAREALSWAELAMSFVQASIRYDSIAELKKIPATVGGLRWFLSTFNERGVNETCCLQRIWAGKDDKAAIPPIPVTMGKANNTWTKKTMRILRSKANQDIQQVWAFRESAGEPPYR